MNIRPNPQLWIVAVLSVAGACSGPTEQSATGAILPGRDNHLIIEDSTSLLGPVRETIVRLAIETTDRVVRLLPVTDVLVRVSPRPAGAVPELGLGGQSLHAREIQISIDPAYPDLPAALQDFFPYILAHEFHHTMRHRDPGYGTVLVESMVSEGLADHFAIEVTSHAGAPWTAALDPDEHDTIETMARAEWYSATYSHGTWFFGTGAIPRWSGYTLGFEIVEAYLELHPTETATSLVDARVEVFVGPR